MRENYYMDCSSLLNKIRGSIALVLVVDSNGKVCGKGSGFIFLRDGILVTCNHVVNKKDASFFIKFYDKENLISAKVIIRDEEHDLAIIKFSDSERRPLSLIESKQIEEGMEVVFSGYPLTLMDLTTHRGILSAITKDAAGITTYMIDGTVNSGNSGCPLMSRDGDVIGVVNAKRREKNDILEKVEGMKHGAIALHGVDLVEIHSALISNVQLGMGYAVPAAFIPEPKDQEDASISDSNQLNKPKSEKDEGINKQLL